jgi:hypothetical protein
MRPRTEQPIDAIALRSERVRIRAARQHGITDTGQAPPSRGIQTTRRAVWQVRFRWSDAP